MSASTHFLLPAIIAVAGALFQSGAAHAADAAPACQPLGHVQKRVVQKAELGVEALRNYVEITRGIHQLDMMTIANSLDGWLAQAHCSGVAADGKAVRQVVALAAMPR